MNEQVTKRDSSRDDGAYEPQGIYRELAEVMVRALRGEYDRPAEIRAVRKKAS